MADMSKALEQIWAFPTERQPLPVKDGKKGAWLQGRWKSYDSRAHGDVEYVRADIVKAEREHWSANSRETFEAMCAMRNSINEYISMPSLESDLLSGPENSVFCEAVANAVISEINRLRAENDQLREERDELLAENDQMREQRFGI